jgi:acetyltransferase
MELRSEEECCVPSFAFPEDTATAIAKACEYNDWLQRPKGVIPEIAGIDEKNGKQIVVTALEHNAVRPFWLSNDAVVDLLYHYGINVVRSKSAMTVEEAVKAADELGYPAVMKLMSGTITHKTEVGGVILDLRSQIEVEKAFIQMKERLINLKRENEMQGVILQQMIPGGVEVIVGLTQDPSFGSLMMFGMGGMYTELFRDVTFRIHPLTDVDAQEMLRSIKAYQLLEGWRGSKPSDVKALEEVLLRISAMIEDLPQIVELDLNPVKVLEQEKGYVVVDARVMVA